MKKKKKRWNKARATEKLEKRIAKTPMRRLGTVEDIASAVCYLASAESAWVTGECLKVDGGVTHAFL